jgi:predicted nucleotidyltransferase
MPHAQTPNPLVNDAFESGGLRNYRFLQRLQVLPFVDALILYGSRARGDHRERSDIDLAVLAPRASDKQWREVLEIVDNADTLLTIDCVRLDALPVNDPLRVNIEREGVSLSRRPNA